MSKAEGDQEMARHDEEPIPRLKPVDQRVILAARDWLVEQGAEAPAVERAMDTAATEGLNTGQSWLEALHKVVNRSARRNEPGWDRYHGDWLKLLRKIGN